MGKLKALILQYVPMMPEALRFGGIMYDLTNYSEPIEIPTIPEGPGIALITNSRGEVLQITASKNIRRRIGELLDSEGHIAVHGPKIYEAQRRGERIFIRWKLTPDYRNEKKKLMKELNPLWAP
jgi:hypothetical protein